MKTIEERAKEYAPDPFLAALERKAYITGATEQKQLTLKRLKLLLAKPADGSPPILGIT